MITSKIKPEGFFINLKHRRDRYDHFFKQQLEFHFFKKLKRFEAIEHKQGAIGCAQSHITVLKKCLEMNAGYFMICEDDVEIIDKKVLYEFQESFKIIEKDENWDIIILSPYGYYKFKDGSSILEKNGFKRVFDSQTTTGYIIKKSFIPHLLENFEHAESALLFGLPENKHAIDQSWKKLQKTCNFYCFSKTFSKQLKGYSDIEKKEVNYNGKNL